MSINSIQGNYTYSNSEDFGNKTNSYGAANPSTSVFKSDEFVKSSSSSDTDGLVPIARKYGTVGGAQEYYKDNLDGTYTLYARPVLYGAELEEIGTLTQEELEEYLEQNEEEVEQSKKEFEECVEHNEE